VDITAAGTTEYDSRCDKCDKGFTLQENDGSCMRMLQRALPTSSYIAENAY